MGRPLGHKLKSLNAYWLLDKMITILARILAVCAILQIAIAQNSDPLDDVLTNNAAYFTPTLGSLSLARTGR